jgi:hypothetical protein
MNNKLIIQEIILMAIITLLMQNTNSFDVTGLSEQDTTKFENVFILGLQGNISQALSYIDTMDVKTLTERQAGLKKKYILRFKTKDEAYDFRIKDNGVISIMKRYQTYWRNVLLDNTKLSREDSSITKWIIKYLVSNYNKVKDRPQTDMEENFTQYLQDYLLTKEIFASVGKTGMFFDLLMHAKETEVTYDVTTPEDTIKVKVVFMEEIISNGWEEYATFGKYYPGGWATSDALYCVKESYDLESENFLVTYLKHEGKHFADYKIFPKLSGADLEYRAKLVELSAANSILFRLIKFFTVNASYDRQNPHGFANFCIMRDLSRLLFSSEMETDIEKWKSIPVEEINKKAEYLLKLNTENLKNEGPETVSEFIK